MTAKLPAQHKSDIVVVSKLLLSIEDSSFIIVLPPFKIAVTGTINIIYF
jgi:hypothetical protein